MPVIRIEKKHMYTVTALFPLRDTRLTLKAKGLLTFILSLPDTWVYTIQGLAQVLKEGPDAIRTSLHELEANGYLVRKRMRDKQGRLGDTEYVIYEIPQVIPEDLRKWISQDWDLPKLENPMLDNPMLDNPIQDYPTQKNRTERNKDVSSKDVSSKDRKNHSINQSIQEIKEIVMESIDYEHLLEDIDRTRLDNVVSAIAAVLYSTKPYTRIGGEEYLTEEVQIQFRKLKADHIRYVCETIDTAKPTIHSVKGYLITALYNSIDTFDIYIHTKAKNDLAYGDYSRRCLDLLNESEEEIE